MSTMLYDVDYYSDNNDDYSKRHCQTNWQYDTMLNTMSTMLKDDQSDNMSVMLNIMSIMLNIMSIKLKDATELMSTKLNDADDW